MPKRLPLLQDRDGLQQVSTDRKSIGPDRFIADRMLGKLARELRLLGYDTLFFKEGDPASLIRLSKEQKRLLLTRSRALKELMERASVRTLFIAEDDPRRQLLQVLKEACLTPTEEMFFSRCLCCNQLLREAPRADVEHRVPDFIFQTHEKFSECPGCRRIYWRGSHHSHMVERLRRLLDDSNLFRTPLRFP